MAFVTPHLSRGRPGRGFLPIAKGETEAQTVNHLPAFHTAFVEEGFARLSLLALMAGMGTSAGPALAPEPLPDALSGLASLMLLGLRCHLPPSTW